MKKFYKKIFIFVVVLIFTGGLGWHMLPLNVVFAEDDEIEQEREYEFEEEYADEEKMDESSKELAQAETVTTEVVTISETQSKEVVTTTKNDKDGDGIFDDEDDYPEINDHFIVKDDNRNGIVDAYEQK